MNWMFDRRLEEKIPGTPAYQKKRKKDLHKQDIFLLNQELQRIFKLIPKEILKTSELTKKIKKANQHVAGSHILNLSYRNNFENEKVAISSVEILLESLFYIPDPEIRKKIWYKTRNPQAQIERLCFPQANFSLLEKKIHQNQLI